MTDRRARNTKTLTASPRAKFHEIQWIRTGPVAIDETPEVVSSNTLLIVGFTAKLTTVGATSTVIQLRKNGTAIATVTLVAGKDYNFVEVPKINVIARKDHYTIAVTSAGSGAVGLSGSIEVAA